MSYTSTTLKKGITMDEFLCDKCLVLPVCMIKFREGRYDSVLNFSYKINCYFSEKFLETANQDAVNKMRLVFGLKPIE